METNYTKFMANVNKTEDCWNWTGGTVQSNYYRYGRFKTAGKSYRAHRYAYQEMVGAIPKDMLVCHHCDNPLCVNPDHLFLGTAQDNASDMVSKNRQAKGTDINNAVLTAAKVKRIRRMYAKRYKNGKRKYTQQQIAERVGCSRRNVSSVVNYKIWSHV